MSLARAKELEQFLKSLAASISSKKEALGGWPENSICAPSEISGSIIQGTGSHLSSATQNLNTF